ncbi:MAG: transposase [Sphingosinicella sp.]|nr:transposase [Sphingosinicella sp.]
MSERRARRAIGLHRSTQRRPAPPRSDEKRLTADIVRLASDYGRYGYRRITALLRREGWKVNAKRVERIWRREGLPSPPPTTRVGWKRNTIKAAIRWMSRFILAQWQAWWNAQRDQVPDGRSLSAW